MRIIRYASVLVLALGLGACTLVQVERWPVKTGSDTDTGRVDLTHAVPTTIAALRALPPPGKLPGNSRLPPVETTLYVVAATLVKYKQASDTDYHLVLADAAGNTMIAEIPNPEDVPADSPLAPGVKRARAEFDHRYDARRLLFQDAKVPVCVQGIGFFDFHHGQEGVAPNAIELHPVVDIVFNPTSCPAKP